MHEVISEKYDGSFKNFDYRKHSWNYEQETVFKDWMISYLQNSKEAREFFMTIESTNLRYIERAVDEFLLAYGWKSEN